MHDIKQVSKSISRTYETLGTLRSDKVAKFIIFNLSVILNIQKLAYLLDPQVMKHKDRNLKD